MLPHNISLCVGAFPQGARMRAEVQLTLANVLLKSHVKAGGIVNASCKSAGKPKNIETK
jgi:hypothetical protein